MRKARQRNAPHPPPPLRKGEWEKRAGDLATVCDEDGFEHLLRCRRLATTRGDLSANAFHLFVELLTLVGIALN